MVQPHVQSDPDAPDAVLHSEFLSHEQEFGVTTSPEFTTTPRQWLDPEQPPAPALHVLPDLSLQSRASSEAAMESSRQSDGSVQTGVLPDAGPVTGAIEIDEHSAPGGGGGGGGQPR